MYIRYLISPAFKIAVDGGHAQMTFGMPNLLGQFINRASTTPA